LDEEDFPAGDVGEAGGVVVEGEGVEAVDDEAESRVVGGLDDAPGLAPGVGIPAPRERFVADAKAAGGGAGGVWQAGGLDVAADQDEVGTEGLHDVELAFGAVEVAAALRVGHRLEIAEGLEDVDGQAEICGDAADIGGGAVDGEDVVLENLHTIEADGGGGFEFFRESAAKRDGGDRGAISLYGHGKDLRVRPKTHSFLTDSSEHQSD
jgi:hypothetical protein